MSKPTLRGFPQSSYVWTARAAFHVKGVDHEFVPMKPGEHKTPEHLAIHPFGKVPVLTDPALWSAMGTTLLLAWSGETFLLCAQEIWVRPIATALAVKQP